MNYQNYKELITVLSLFVYIVVFVFRFQKIKLKDLEFDDPIMPLFTAILLGLLRMAMFVSIAAGGLFMMLWFLQEGFKFIETTILG